LRARRDGAPLPLSEIRACRGADLQRREDLRVGLRAGWRQVPARAQPWCNFRSDRGGDRLFLMEDARFGRGWRRWITASEEAPSANPPPPRNCCKVSRGPALWSAPSAQRPSRYCAVAARWTKPLRSSDGRRGCFAFGVHFLDRFQIGRASCRESVSLPDRL